MRSFRRSLSHLFVISWCLDFFILYANSLHEDVRGNSTEVEVSPRMLSRQKRYLIFPEGSNLQLVYCLTIGAYGRNDDLVMGLTAALAWELPSKVDSKISDLLHRRSRSVMFPKVEAFLQSTGIDGRSCVMKALCEAGQRHPSQIGKGTFVQELLHAIFTLPRDGGRFECSEDRPYERAYQNGGNCEKLYPTCRYSIYSVDL
ncbi:uncharacterized protein LOC124953596 [Vespa velutina]|uniref:uncharacterized protein LOC124953596 n=1 Tax=Vespa velutina TaxID=202808 RepID=UPI001FB4183C|nr:uncharacterized protein LOC124953596 [Vespa velutina]XP_047361132.1 uncharacterized protein LOC124953596 [Vespa velutina]